jgi:HTH-type transcriptional repressor of NAD biosynthesis genes
MVHHLNRRLEQNPEAEGFWDMWVDIMTSYGAQPGDYYVTSEPYGKTMAEKMNGIFMPYDPERKLYYTKATQIRNQMKEYFHDILPEFQHVLRTNVVIFGAESTGKTTLSEKLSDAVNGHWLFEWARPYLEIAGPDIHKESMEAIWKGQRALQDHSKYLYDKPFAIFDTDLFSTVGYWEQPHWTESLGPVPEELVNDALARKADLYIITRSNIPFEKDPIRYGGDRRESPDDFWIGIAEKYGLNYVVLDEVDLADRIWAATTEALWASDIKAREIDYEREHNA